MKSYFSLVVSVIIVLGIFLSGCSSKSSSDGEEKTVLNVALWDENISPVIDKSVADFEESHPNVDVKVTYTPWADYWTKLRTSLAGGSGPDVFWMNGGYQQYVTSGLVKDLQPLIDKESYDTSVFIPSLVDLYTYKDDLYGLPYFLDSIALFYNKKLFDDAGIAYPDDTWTWDDIEEVGAKLTNKEDGVYGYIAQTGEPQKGYYNLIYQAGGHIIDKETMTSGFNSPESVSAFKWMESLIKKGISPTAEMQVETAPEQLFGSGKAAMIPLISVNVAEMKELLGEDLGIAPLPAGKQKGTVVHGLSWMINDKTKEADLSWELTKSLASEKSGEYVAESGFSIPAYQGTEDMWVKSIPDVDLQVFIDSLEFGISVPVSKDLSAWNDFMKKELQDAFLGKQTIEEATKKIEDKMNEVLASE